MANKALGALVASALLLGGTASGWAQNGSSEKKIYDGPSKTSFGRLDVVLPSAARSEVQYQPDLSRLQVKTVVGEARIVTSARYLVLVENLQGKVEILVGTGRVILVEPGKAEIVGRALVDDPGQLIIRLSGTGPLAQLGPPAGGPGAEVVATVLDETNPAAAKLTGVVTNSVVDPPTKTRGETSPCVSPVVSGAFQGFGAAVGTPC